MIQNEVTSNALEKSLCTRVVAKIASTRQMEYDTTLKNYPTTCLINIQTYLNTNTIKSQFI